MDFFDDFASRWRTGRDAPLCAASMVRHMASFVDNEADAPRWPPLPPLVSLNRVVAPPLSLLSVADHARFFALQSTDGKDLSERACRERIALRERVSMERSMYRAHHRDVAAQRRERYVSVHREAVLMARSAALAAQLRAAVLPRWYAPLRTYALAPPPASASHASLPPPRLVSRVEARGRVPLARVPHALPAQLRLDPHATSATLAAELRPPPAGSPAAQPLRSRDGALGDPFARELVARHGASVAMSEAALLVLLDDVSDGTGGAPDIMLPLSVRRGDGGGDAAPSSAAATATAHLHFGEPLPAPVAHTPARVHNAPLFVRRFEALCVAPLAGEAAGKTPPSAALLYSVLALGEKSEQSSVGTRVLVRSAPRVDARCALSHTALRIHDARAVLAAVKVEHLAEFGAERIAQDERARWYASALVRGLSAVAIARVKSTDGSVLSVETLGLDALDAIGAPKESMRACARFARLNTLLRRLQHNLPQGDYLLRRLKRTDGSLVVHFECLAACENTVVQSAATAAADSASRFDLHDAVDSLLVGTKVCDADWMRSYVPLRWTARPPPRSGGGDEEESPLSIVTLAGAVGNDGSVRLIEETLPPIVRHHCQSFAAFGFCDGLRLGGCGRIHIRGPLRVHQNEKVKGGGGRRKEKETGGLYARLFEVCWPRRTSSDPPLPPPSSAKRAKLLFSASASTSAQPPLLDTVYIRCPSKCGYCWAYNEGRVCHDEERDGVCSYPHLSRPELLESIARHLRFNGIDGVVVKDVNAV